VAKYQPKSASHDSSMKNMSEELIEFSIFDFRFSIGSSQCR
jgi:hypothetical protein